MRKVKADSALGKQEAYPVELFDDSPVDGELTFFVGWKSGVAYQLRRIDVHESIAEEFRNIAKLVLFGQEPVLGINWRQGEPWTPDAIVSPETYLECDIGKVGDEPKLVGRPSEDRFLEVLLAAEDLEVIDASQLDRKRLNLYGFAIGSPGERIVFIRRANPRRGLDSGKFFGRFGDTIRRITEPIFAFDSRIDFIVAGQKLIILSQEAFAMLFRDQESLKALIPKWVDSLSSQIPVDVASLDSLTAAARGDSRVRQRLESVVTRGHLALLTNSQLESAMTSCGLDTSKYLNHNSELCFTDDKEEIRELLTFLNEDLYEGILTGQAFRVDRKAER